MEVGGCRTRIGVRKGSTYPKLGDIRVSRRGSRQIADFYEDEVDTSIAALTSIVEPLMMIGVGAIVGIIVIAMYLPMFKLLELVQ